MVDELDDTVVPAQTPKQLDFVGVALVCLRVGVLQPNTFQRVHLALRVAEHRVDLRRAAAAEKSEAVVSFLVDLCVRLSIQLRHAPGRPSSSGELRPKRKASPPQAVRWAEALGARRVLEGRQCAAAVRGLMAQDVTSGAAAGCRLVAPVYSGQSGSGVVCAPHRDSSDVPRVRALLSPPCGISAGVRERRQAPAAVVVAVTRGAPHAVGLGVPREKALPFAQVGSDIEEAIRVGGTCPLHQPRQRTDGVAPPSTCQLTLATPLHCQRRVEDCSPAAAACSSSPGITRRAGPPKRERFEIGLVRRAEETEPNVLWVRPGVTKVRRSVASSRVLY